MRTRVNGAAEILRLTKMTWSAKSDRLGLYQRLDSPEFWSLCSLIRTTELNMVCWLYPVLKPRENPA